MEKRQRKQRNRKLHNCHIHSVRTADSRDREDNISQLLLPNSDLKYDKINIELRRGKVLELLAKGNSQTEIAKALNVSNALISLDIQYLREQAQKELETHIVWILYISRLVIMVYRCYCYYYQHNAGKSQDIQVLFAHISFC